MISYKTTNVAKKLGTGRQLTLNNVISKFKTLKDAVLEYALDPDDMQKIIIVIGDSGVGKSMFISQGLEEAKKLAPKGRKLSHKLQKGGEFSKAGLYINLFQHNGNATEKRILWCDDTTGILDDSVNLGILKAATESSHKPRRVSWPKQPSPFMQKNNIGTEFDYWGHMIISCNEDIGALMKKSKIAPHLKPIMGRATPIKIRLSDDEAYVWTNYMITGTYDILGKHCELKKGGFAQKVVDDTLEFIKEYRGVMNEVTPRAACQIAKTRHLDPKGWLEKCEQSFTGGWDWDKA